MQHNREAHWDEHSPQVHNGLHRARALHIPPAVLRASCSLPHCTVRDRGKSPAGTEFSGSPCPNFPPRPWEASGDFRMHGPCTRQGISIRISPGHTDNPGASLPSLPSAGGPVWIPAGAGGPPVAEHSPTCSRAGSSTERVPAQTSAKAPISCSPPPASLPLVSLPEHRHPQVRSHADFPGAEFLSGVSQQEFPPGSLRRPRARTPLQSVRERRVRGGSSGCRSGCSGGSKSRRDCDSQTFIRLRHSFPESLGRYLREELILGQGTEGRERGGPVREQAEG